MNPSVRRLAPILLLVSLFAVSGSATGTFDPTQFSRGDFQGCPPTGEGGDPYLSTLKNRDKPPTGQVALYTVNQLYNATPALPTKKVSRSKWTPTQRALAAKWECKAVMVEGYLIHVPIREKQEACNCESTQYADHHMWLAQTASSPRSLAMVVEISPRGWMCHPNWKNAAVYLKPVVDNKEKVRVTGWLTYDQEHHEQVGKTRRTLYEVHPIHAIQVWRGNKWVTL
jgi:hypothetical protein